MATSSKHKIRSNEIQHGQYEDRGATLTFGQKHVLREDVHAVDTLLPETVRERMVTVEVLLERAPEDRAVPVRREGTGQYRYVTETTLEGLV